MIDVQALARIYDESPSLEVSPGTKQDLKILIDFLYEQLPYAIRFVDFQPYENHTQMIEAVQNGGPLLISSQFNDSVIFDSETNLKFRAVHDSHHIALNADFSIVGEYATFEEIARLTENTTIRQVLYSEIVLQAASAIVNGEFKLQKLVLTEV